MAFDMIDSNVISVRIMAKRDVKFALMLQNIVGWGNTSADIERSLYYEPKGCFIASLNGVDLGIVNSYLYGKVGFIGNLIVNPEIRGKGVGAELMKQAIKRLTLAGAETIRLDGVQKAITLYERLGFKGEYWSLRYSGIAVKAPFKGVEPIVVEDLKQIMKLDSRFCGFDRDQKLTRVLKDFPHLCYKVSKNGEIRGFIMARLGTSNVRVGPWICDPKYGELAEYLLNALASKVEGSKIWVGIPEFNRLSVNIIESKMFDQMPSSLRMCYGSLQNREDISGIFGVGAADKG
jgi:GNAT superfamily N-acetyltransferase